MMSSCKEWTELWSTDDTIKHDALRLINAHENLLYNYRFQIYRFTTRREHYKHADQNDPQ